jgi:hypothetical protein
VAEEAYEELTSLPMYPAMTDGDVCKVNEVLAVTVIGTKKEDIVMPQSESEMEGALISPTETHQLGFSAFNFCAILC